MWNKIIYLGLILLLVSLMALPVFAHSGRLDGSGGHRVNKEWVYTGRYLYVHNGVMMLGAGTIVFKPGDYHYHVHPRYNGYKDGIYLPVKGEEIKYTRTDLRYISEENRVASKESNIYHRPDCRHIEKIKEENIIIFEDPEDAEKNGYIPCKHCKPDEVSE